METTGPIEYGNGGMRRCNPDQEESSTAQDCSGSSTFTRGEQAQSDYRASIIRTSLTPQHTPNQIPADERIVESWIQQSLSMPSAINEPNESTSTNHLADRNSLFTTTTSSLTAISGLDGFNDASNTTAHHSRQNSLDSYSFLTQGCSNADGPRNNEMGSTLSHPYGEVLWGSNSVMTTADESFFTSSNSLFLPAVQDPVGEAGATGSVNVNVVSSDIHDAARIGNWETVARLCEEKPESAAYIGGDAWTALHHACNRRCPYPKVVEALINAYPDALLIAEEKGWLPLHYACRFKAPKAVVELLLHMYKDKGNLAVSKPDRRGRSPLYYAVRYDAPTGVASLLIEKDPSAVLEEDRNADSPLALVWNDWAEKSVGKKTLQQILVGTEENQNIDFNASFRNWSFGMNAQLNLEDRIKNSKLVRQRLERQPKVLERWNRVNRFLKAAFGFRLEEDWELVERLRIDEEEKKDTRHERKWRVLHAVSAIKCHYTLFLLAFSLHPEQAFELDSNDLRRTDRVYNKSKGSSECNPSNLTALHLAASSNCGGEPGRKVITQLLSLNSSAVKRVDSEGSTPLHMISENKFKSEWIFVDEVYGSNKDAIMAIDTNGRLPLHRASKAIAYFNKNIGNDSVVSRSVICNLLREYPDAARTPDHFGCLPLHLLAQNGGGWDVQAQTLFDANPDAAEHRAGVKCYERFPLHFAAQNVDSDFTMIGKLAEAYPEAARQADRKGFYPLHLACESGHSWKSVELIHDAFRVAVKQTERNRRGWYALHMAASSESSDEELISKLAELHPQAALVADNDGRLPLHLACMANKDWENGLSCLFDANPNSIKCPDKDGMLPLHIVAFRCCLKPCSVDDTSPEPANIRSRNLSMTSEALEKERLAIIHAAETKEAKELNNIFEIVRADPTALMI